MMRESGQTLFEIAAEVHRGLRKRCEELNGQADSEKLNDFIRYLREHEAHMQGLLSEHQTRAGEDTRKRIFRYTPEETPLDLLDRDGLSPDLSADEAMERAIRLRNRLIEWYEQLAADASAPGVKEDLERLMTVERNMNKKLTRCAQGIS